MGMWLVGSRRRETRGIATRRWGACWCCWAWRRHRHAGRWPTGRPRRHARRGPRRRRAVRAALVLPGLARDPWALAGALLVFGFGSGCLDVSMNAHAVHVEKAYNRPVMGLPCLVLRRQGHRGARRARATSAGSVPPRRSASPEPRALWSPCCWPAPAGDHADLPDHRRVRFPHHRTAPGGPSGEAAHPSRPHLDPRRSALMCMLCEGVANDWSSLDLKTILGTGGHRRLRLRHLRTTMTTADCSPIASPGGSDRRPCFVTAQPRAPSESRSWPSRRGYGWPWRAGRCSAWACPAASPSCSAPPGTPTPPPPAQRLPGTASATSGCSRARQRSAG